MFKIGFNLPDYALCENRGERLKENNLKGLFVFVQNVSSFAPLLSGQLALGVRACMRACGQAGSIKCAA